jgi:phosphoribosylanthranilate isomerase
VSTRLKICGITSFNDAKACAELGVDYLGFNFFSSSPRFIFPKRASSIIQNLPQKIKSVAIIVRPKLSEVMDIIKQTGVDLVQIIEPLDFGDFYQIPVPVIITKRVNKGVSEEYNLNGASMILFDTYTKNELGGSGKIFDWSLIPESIPREKLVLAGGITPVNVEEALIKVKPAIIDVASGAEIKPGIKDLNKVRQLVAILRKY